MPFADELIGVPTARALTAAIQAAAPSAELAALPAAAAAIATLSLRERSDLLRDALLTDLPGDYDTFAGTIRAAAQGALPFSGWLIWPVTSAVAAKAIDAGTDAAFDDGMRMLAALTPRLTSEFAIRPLLTHDLARAMPIVLGWTGSTDPAVRRLASEGTRPFLPWAIRVPGILAEPTLTLPVLHALYRDEDEVVRRSVANHLNDLSRQQPDLVVATTAGWLAAPDANTVPLVRHALRTLVKKGHPQALAQLGFHPAEVHVVGPVLDAADVDFGGTIGFTVSIRNAGDAPARLAVDYVMHHRKANGSLTGKTFKLTTVTLAAGETVQLARSHSFRAITTRRYHPGVHALEVQVNGAAWGRVEFTLLPGD
ncbi:MULTISPECIES: DNA alkylation repair protein [Cryobacterium]|uniref:DNA alkylation repair protein n=1 Tax=Cryobacterium TaxID=69578 RepID=UPI000CD47004|nr:MULTISPECIES: DNA alkylation repair protein [Cryobacterium]POH63585.1 DNA alkylation repair protein [Cryobacterium zongtaii]TFC42076.1 DNA alkylation repair protein [Cryobacterium sp. TMN-39-2]